MPRPDLFDVLALIGLAAMSVGFSLYWPPVGLIVAGAGLLTIGVMGSRGVR
jgi:hypothetical protein